MPINRVVTLDAQPQRHREMAAESQIALSNF